MSCPTVNIVAVKNSLQTCTPNLMPFHLNYSGHAPIATYFRVKPTTLQDQSRDGLNGTAQRSEETTETEQSGLQAVNSPGTVTASQTISAESDILIDATPSTQSTDQVTNQRKSSLGPRFVAAFRGRTVHGLAVDLPEGYGGIILRPDVDMNGKDDIVEHEVSEKETKGRGRAKRGRVTRYQSPMNIDEDAGMEVDSKPSQEDDRAHERVRTLNPTATFSSFVLWNPDLPVDGAKDEYLRSLTEWTDLAAQVSLLVVSFIFRF